MKKKIPVTEGKTMHRRRTSGFTLVETCIALGLTTMLSAGLYASGIQARRFAEHDRLATEARAMAEERLEEIVAVGLTGLRQPSCTLLASQSLNSSQGYAVERVPQVVWHSSNGAICNAADALYAEVHVGVSYHSPALLGEATDIYSTLVH